MPTADPTAIVRPRLPVAAPVAKATVADGEAEQQQADVGADHVPRRQVEPDGHIGDRHRREVRGAQGAASP